MEIFMIENICKRRDILCSRYFINFIIFIIYNYYRANILVPFSAHFVVSFLSPLFFGPLFGN